MYELAKKKKKPLKMRKCVHYIINCCSVCAAKSEATSIVTKWI